MENSAGILGNMSTSGAYFMAKQSLSIGTPVILYVPLKLSSAKKMCVVSGTIVRTEKGNSSALFGYGIQFDADISSSSKRLLTHFVDTKTDGKLSRVLGIKPSPKVPAPSKGERPLRDYTRRAQYKLRIQQRSTLAKASDRPQKSGFMGKRGSAFCLKAYAAGTMIVLFATQLGYQIIQTHLQISQFEQIMPLRGVTIENDILRATAMPEWFFTRSEATRATELDLLTKMLEEKKLLGAKILDDEGTQVARILRDQQSKKLVGQLLH